MHVNPTVSDQMPLTSKHHDSAISITTVNGDHSWAGLVLTQNLLFVLSLSQQGNTKLCDGTKIPFARINYFFLNYMMTDLLDTILQKGNFSCHLVLH